MAVLPALIVAGGLALVGCGTFGYAFSAAFGQLNVAFSSRPVEEVLASGELSETQADRMRFILDVRRFGIDRIGLIAGNSYTVYYDTAGEPPAYNLSASRKDAFEPWTWTFPILGAVPYLGFFSLEEAEAYEVPLREDEGLDTQVVRVGAYSTLGFFADPIFSSMLDRDEIALSDLILHEMTHNTVYRNGDSDFNESLATFVGRAASRVLLEERFGIDAPMLDDAADRHEDSDRYIAFLSRVYDTLDAFYNTDLTSEQKIADRDAIYGELLDEFEANELPLFHNREGYRRAIPDTTNNAWVLANRRYNLDLDLFEHVHQATGEDFPTSIAVFREAARADDAKAYLRDWLAAQSTPLAE